jgi:hypothetical protein
MSFMKADPLRFIASRQLLLASKPITSLACPRYLGFAVFLLCGTILRADAIRYSWQESQAEVLPTGDLRWQPRPFVFQTGATVRYIDYEKGDDTNAGDTTARPWKHHPWDAHATGRAKADAGRDTYVFKRGVTYRGRLVAATAGTAEAPIILTSDPSWGEGEAVLAGSERVTGWSRGGHPDMPDRDKVWQADIDFLPRAAWLVTPGTIRRLALARTPNWEIESWDDIHSQWATWKHVEQVERDGETMNRGEDPDLLGRYTPQQLAGALVWSEYDSYMGTAYPTAVLLNEATPKSIDFKHWVPGVEEGSKPNDRYFLEDRPAFLDAPGEFWFERKGDGGRLYVRLPDDLDPSTAQVEAARYLAIIDATELRHVRVRGLTFRFTNLQWDITEHPLGNPDVDPAAIRLEGSGNDIVIDHCRFEYVTRAVRLRATPNDGGSIDNVHLTDNDVRDTDHGAFWITDGVRYLKIDPPYGKVGRVEILRNRAERIGFRPHPRSHGHAIQVDYAEITEVAGNILDHVHGAGLFIFGGIADGQTRDGPLSRHLIYQNRVNQPLLGTNDWGGIETWQAGPFYVFNNVSVAPGGYWHAHSVRRHAEPGPYTYMDSRYAYAYYLDGSSKNYLFNNVALGSNNDPASPLCNTGALHEIAGQDNLFFNNSFARFAVAFVGFTRTSVNSAYLGNVFEDMSLADWYFSSPRKLATGEDSQFSIVMRGARHKGELALDNNLLSGRQAAAVGTAPWDHRILVELPAFRAALTRFEKANVPVGEIVPRRLLPRYSEGDFRPADDPEVAGRGAKVFVPWGLYACVAEWGFRPRGDDPSVVIDEHCYYTWGYLDRMRYSSLPRHDLQGVGISRADFFTGPLGDWTADALRLDGIAQYLVLPDAGLYRPTRVERTAYKRPGAPLTYDRAHWRTPDVGTASFLIEAYLRPAAGRGGLLLAKHDGRTGYMLEIDSAGHPRLRLEQAGQLVAQSTAATSVADNAWHHLVVEIDRAKPDGITFWIDGLQDKGEFTGKVIATDLDNPSDVLIGGGPGKSFFKGDFAFLRLCLGTLADARTTIDELRAWEFAGPQLADFTGRVPPGKRDAGALQSRGHSQEP